VDESLIMAVDLKQHVGELMLTGAKSCVDTVLYFFPNIVNLVHIGAVFWPSQHFSIVTV
jgi:hypothetical protein